MRPILDILPGPLGRGPILQSEAWRTEKDLEVMFLFFMTSSLSLSLRLMTY